MKKLYARFLAAQDGQIGWPGLVGALIIAFLAIVVYKVLFEG